MTTTPISYRIPSERVVGALLEDLRGRYTVTGASRIARRMTYLDTFDWRLFRAGARLAEAREKTDRFLMWRPADGSDGFYREELERTPEFAWDLPPGRVRETVEPIVEMRRLLPVVALNLEGRVWRVLDDRMKTVAELVLERGRAGERGPSARGVSLAPTLRLIPVMGFDRDARELGVRLERFDGTRAVDGGLLEQALERLGRDPVEESRKPGWALTPDMRSDDAMKAIYRAQLTVMERNVHGIVKDIDTEFLHDFRVAVRRTRSGLAQVPGVFPSAVVADFGERFKWLGRTTGPLRDADVHLLDLPGYRDALGPELADALGPVERRLTEQRRAEQLRLAPVLESDRYRRLVASWGAFLARPVPRRSRLPNATRPIVDVAAERIARVHRKVLKRGRAIKEDSPADRLHRLRIECKKLRYLLEFFAGLYPADRIGRLIKALKRLQTNLGDFNDLTVQRREFLDWMETPEVTETGGERTGRALGALLERIERRASATRAEFHERFASFASPKVGAVFLELFGDPPR